MKLVWIDLETTGFDPDRHVVIAAGCIITDFALNELAEIEVIISRPELTIDDLEDGADRIHTDSGLFARCQTEGEDAGQAALRLSRFLSGHVERRQAYLAGSSVWFDREFLSRWAPHVVQHLHHRIVDVSCLRVLLSEWRPSVAHKKAEAAHLPLEDLRGSINELAGYRAALGLA